MGGHYIQITILTIQLRVLYFIVLNNDKGIAIYCFIFID